MTKLKFKVGDYVVPRMPLDDDWVENYKVAIGRRAVVVNVWEEGDYPYILRFFSNFEGKIDCEGVKWNDKELEFADSFVPAEPVNKVEDVERFKVGDSFIYTLEAHGAHPYGLGSSVDEEFIVTEIRNDNYIVNRIKDNIFSLQIPLKSTKYLKKVEGKDVRREESKPMQIQKYVEKYTEYKPKLKVGDSFIYPKEAHEKMPVCMGNVVGKVQMVEKIKGEEYHLIDGWVLGFEDIDPFLPEVEEQKPIANLFGIGIPELIRNPEAIEKRIQELNRQLVETSLSVPNPFSLNEFSYQEFINLPNILTKKPMNLVHTLKMALKQEPEKSLLQLDIVTEDGELTHQGKTLFINWLFESNKQKFFDEVVSVIKKEKEKASK